MIENWVANIESLRRTVLKARPSALVRSRATLSRLLRCVGLSSSKYDAADCKWPRENAMAKAFSGRCEKQYFVEMEYKNQTSAYTAIRLSDTNILNSNVADITEYFLLVYQTTLY
ncbi:hypothetical protein TNCV_191411 [Trichonephila clavipes]|nr:hypothetical protein TNCV_191411 [Trichonephila clavipes]